MAEYNKSSNGVSRIVVRSKRLDWHQNGKLVGPNDHICPNDWEFGSYVVVETIGSEVTYARPAPADVIRPELHNGFPVSPTKAKAPAPARARA